MNKKIVLKGTTAALTRLVLDFFSIDRVYLEDKQRDPFFVTDARSLKDVGKKASEKVGFKSFEDLNIGSSQGAFNPKVIEQAVVPESRLILRGTLLHEIIHSLKIRNNHYVLAHAISNYIQLHSSFIPYVKPTAGLFHTIEKQCSPSAIGIRAREEFESKRSPDTIKARVEYNKSKLGPSFADTGSKIASLAIQLEREMGKPGIGLFLIREIVKGNKVAPLIREIHSGKYEEQRLCLLKRHQMLRRTIAPPQLYHVMRRKKVQNQAHLKK
jgi:hypothetical protein